MNEKHSFVLHTDIGQHLALLDDTECGKLFRAVVAYADDGTLPAAMSPAGQMAFSFIKAQLDRDSQKWDEVREKRRMAGRAGAAVTNGKRAANAANADFAEQKAANPAVTVPVPVTVPVTVPVNKESESADKPRRPRFVPPGEPEVLEYFQQQGSTAREAPALQTPKEKAPPKRKYGQYGWVRLTDSQYAGLEAKLGRAELERCITYIDESAQTNGNKNGWKDWNLLIQRCSREGWGTGRKAQGSARSAKNVAAAADLAELFQDFGGDVTA